MKYRRVIIFSTSAYVYGAERGLLLLIKWGLRKKLFERIHVVLPGKGPLQEMLSGNPCVNVITAPFPFILGSDRSMTLKTLSCLPFSVLYWVLYLWTHRIQEVISNTSLVSVSLPLALLFPHALFVRECFPGKRWFSRYQKLLCRVSRQVFAVSSFVEKQLTGKRTRLLHEPIDSSLYHFYSQEEARKQWRIPSGARVVSFVGRLHPAKGCDDFLSAIEALGTLAGAPDVFFLIAGDIHPRNSRMREYKKNVLERIRKISLKQGIAFLGYVADIGSVYAASDICVFPCRRDEFYGFSILEALFYGKKILLSRCGGGVSDYLTVPSEAMKFTQGNLLQAMSSRSKKQLYTVRFPKLSTYMQQLESALA